MPPPSATHQLSGQLIRHRSAATKSLHWRSSIQLRRTAAEVSAILIQLKDPITHLRSCSLLPTNPPPSLIRRILSISRSHPEPSLCFFEFSKSHLNFQPDLRTTITLINTLVHHTAFTSAATHLLHPLLLSQSTETLINSTIRINSPVTLDFILESYSNQSSISNALRVFEAMKAQRLSPSSKSCDSLLRACFLSNSTDIAWQFYAAALRAGSMPGPGTWVLLVQLLCRGGRLECAKVLLDSGYCCGETYELIVDCFAKKGDFRAAVDLLFAMQEKGIDPGFSTYSSILDGGCMFGNVCVVRLILREMLVKELIPSVPFLNFSSVIKQFCDLNRTYAAEMILEYALDENFLVDDVSFAAMLVAYSNAGRLEQAIDVYRMMLSRGIEVDGHCLDVFLSGICCGEPSQEVEVILKDALRRGSVPPIPNLSKYIIAQCSRAKWSEANDLLDTALGCNILPEASCCCLLVENFCANGLVDSAVKLHDNIRKFRGRLEVSSYNVLLQSLLLERRIEDAIEVFDYMREENVLSSETFVIIIRYLCAVKELRKAMKLHDEMLKLYLKPDDATYKHLILGFA